MCGKREGGERRESNHANTFSSPFHRVRQSTFLIVTASWPVYWRTPSGATVARWWSPMSVHPASATRTRTTHSNMLTEQNRSRLRWDIINWLFMYCNMYNLFLFLHITVGSKCCQRGLPCDKIQDHCHRIDKRGEQLRESVGEIDRQTARKRERERDREKA